jgi:hypothetical protein
MILMQANPFRWPTPSNGPRNGWGGGRVGRSYLLKAKISKNMGIFVLALKQKKCVFFALFACKRNTQNNNKNESEISQKRKEKRKITIPVKI